MRPSEKEKLAEAQEYFRRYQFRQAYHIYRQSFSTLPFQLSDAHLEHVSHYARTLLELDRVDELKFYLPILEQHFEKAQNPQIAYALGYVHAFTGSKVRGQRLFEYARDKAGEDPDMRIKAVMMLAWLSPVSDTVALIHSLNFEARDPQLAKLLEIWRCIALRHQGRTGESIQRLSTLVSSTDSQKEWYCLLSAKDALIRAHLQAMEFDSARAEIGAISREAEWGKFRTVGIHIERLDNVYRKQLSQRTILAVEKRGTTELSHLGHTIRVNQPGMREMIQLFGHKPTLTIRKATNLLKVSQDELRETAARFASRLTELQLPKDSLGFEGIRVHLVPALRVSAKANGGLAQW